MSAAVIAEILNALATAAPEIMTLFQQATNGTAITEAQVQALLSKYSIDQVALTAAIAAAKAAGK
jgi:hypothetical protein